MCELIQNIVNSVAIQEAQITQQSFSNQAAFCRSLCWIRMTNLNQLLNLFGKILNLLEIPNRMDSY